MTEWTKDASGKTIVNPLIDQHCVTIPAEEGVGMRLQYLVEGDDLAAPSGNMQLLMTPAQARELAHALLKAARGAGVGLTIERAPKPNQLY
jgi:hypothetical protein